MILVRNFVDVILLKCLHIIIILPNPVSPVLNPSTCNNTAYGALLNIIIPAIWYVYTYIYNNNNIIMIMYYKCTYSIRMYL